MRTTTLAGQTPSFSLSSAETSAFRNLLVVRVLTVLNDNLARWLVIGMGMRAVRQVGSSDAAVLTIGTIVYVLPFILLAWLSGWLGDRLAKRTVVVAGKAAEIGIATATAVCAAWGAGSGPLIAGIPMGLWLMMGTTGLFAIQTTLLNPSLLGTIPETVPQARLAAANGMFAMVSLGATLAGMAAGNWLADLTWVPAGQPHESATGFLAGVPFANALPAAAALLCVAIAGWLVSLRLPRIPPADPSAPPPWNVLTKTVDDMKRLAGSPQLAGAAAGIVVFWAVAAVAQLNVDQYAKESGATTQSENIPLLVSLVSGIGIGSLIAGRYSRRGIDAGSKVDLGFVPLGAALMVVGCGALAVSGGAAFADGGPTWRLVIPVFWLMLLGLGAGMFDVPLEASMQEKSPPGRLAAVLASTNLLVFSGMLLASLGYYGLRVEVGEGELARPLFSARGVFAVFGLLSLIELAVAVYAAPRATLRIIVRGLVHLRYRFEIQHEDRVPERGPLVVVANHISWLDGFVVVLACPRPIRMVVFGPNIRGRFLRMLSDQWRFILFDPKPKSIGRAMKTIQAGLADGDCIGIFCEGGISRTGQILPFKRGLDWIFNRIEAPMTPLSIDGMWGSVLSFSEGRSLSKWPRSLSRRQLTLTYGPCLPAGTPASSARFALQELAARAVRRRMLSTRSGPRDMNRWCRSHRRRVVVIEAGGRRLTGRELHRQWQTSGLWDRIDQDGHQGVDWAGMAATAEAFDGACLLRRSDTLLSTLTKEHTLGGSLGQFAGPLLGMHAIWAEPPAAVDAIDDLLASVSASIWVAERTQLMRAVESTTRLPKQLEAIVVPLVDVRELPAFEETAAAIRETHGITPVAAFAPRCCGGLVAMNTPSSRNVSDHELTSKPGTLGRILNGSVFWPSGDLRRSLGLADSAGVEACPGSQPLVLGAGFSGSRAQREDLAAFTLPELAIDSDGFLAAAPDDPA
jgi:acyl-[acyl-carrier-protein]-phospholipid O-acyltransferase/long-chain-fatty-acid--[acyl-carrier-protein] ligase